MSLWKNLVVSRKLIGGAILRWRKMHNLSECSAKVGMVMKATRQRNLRDCLKRRGKTMSCRFDTNAEDILSWRCSKWLCKASLELTHRKSGYFRQFFRAYWMGKIPMDFLDHLLETTVEIPFPFDLWERTRKTSDTDNLPSLVSQWNLTRCDQTRRFKNLRRGFDPIDQRLSSSHHH